MPEALGNKNRQQKYHVDFLQEFLSNTGSGMKDLTSAQKLEVVQWENDFQNTKGNNKKYINILKILKGIIDNKAVMS